MPVCCCCLEMARLSTVPVGAEKFMCLMYGSAVMAAESVAAFLLRLRDVFAPYFGAVALLLFLLFLMFCAVDYMLVAAGFLG